MADSLNNLIKRLRKYNAKKHDEVLPMSAIQFTGETYVLNGNPINATDTAVRQMCTIAKIPAAFYIDRLSATEKATIFNRLVGEIRTEMKFRGSNGTIYGIVSPSYKVMDNVILIDLLREIRDSGFDLIPVGSILNPDHSKVRLIPADMEPQSLSPLIEFQNGENGLSSLRLMVGVYRVQCSNGLLAPVRVTRSRWIHFGESKVLLPDLNLVMEQARKYTALLEMSRRHYLSATEKSEIIVALSKALGQQIADEVVSTANKFYQGGLTSFHAIQAITQTAQQYQPAQQSLIEQYAGLLLN